MSKQNTYAAGDGKEIPLRPDKPQEEDGVDSMKIHGAKTIEKDVVLFFTRHETSITDHPKWHEIVKRVLTEKQLETFRTSVQKRNQNLLKNAVGEWLSGLDEQIYLSSNQRTEIREHVYVALSKQVTFSMPNEVRKAKKMVEREFNNLDEGIRKILSPKQVERWNKTREPGTRPSVGWQ